MTRPRTLAAAAMSAVALTAAGCGDDEGRQIPAAQSTALRDQLQQIKEQLNAGDACNVRETTLTTLEAQVSSLPDNLDEDVRQSVEDGVDRLRELVDEECAGQPQPEEEQTDTEETAPIVPTEPETDTEETEPIPTEPEEEPDTEEEGGEGVPGGNPGSGGIGPGGE